MIAINFQNLIDNFSELKATIANGEEIIIEDAGHPIAKITPYHQPRVRKLGGDAGKIWISDDFTAALPESLLQEFYK